MSARRNLLIAPNAENVVPAGRFLYWDRNDRRLVASDHGLLREEQSLAPPPNELGPLLSRLFASIHMTRWLRFLRVVWYPWRSKD